MVTHTIGVDFFTKQVKVEGAAVRLQLWDIAGQDRFFSPLTRSYYYGAEGAMLVCDASSPGGLSSISKWCEVMSSAIPQFQHGFPVVVVANKCDLGVQIGDRDLHTIATGVGAAGVFKASARSGENVTAAFRCLAEAHLEARRARALRHASPGFRTISPSISLDARPEYTSVVTGAVDLDRGDRDGARGACCDT